MRALRVFAVLLVTALQGCISLQPPPVAAAHVTVRYSRLASLRQGLKIATPPPGYVDFCVRLPDQCTWPRQVAQNLILDDDTWNMLRDVNLETNRALVPQDDKTHYGV